MDENALAVCVRLSYRFGLFRMRRQAHRETANVTLTNWTSLTVPAKAILSIAWTKTSLESSI
jgi:hypothetical protein